MYDWLGDALEGPAQVVTASRRLSRELAADYAEQQLAAGRRTWASPAICSWQDWLGVLVDGAAEQAAVPARLNSHHSKILWERCLRREIADPLANMSLLVRQARDTWSRMRDFGVTVDECRRTALSGDQRLFAAAAAAYQSILERENWVDDAGLADLVLQHFQRGNLAAPERLTLAGFDRIVPRVASFVDALQSTGVAVDFAATGRRAGTAQLHVFDNRDEELRSAGAWARRALSDNPRQRIGVVVNNLEQDASRYARLLREGLAPGWQYGGHRHAMAVNVSYGQPLSRYPACEIALLLLRWLHTELTGRDIGLLLRSPFFGGGDIGGRTRLELRLRRLPDRRWTPAMFLREFGDKNDDDAAAWLESLGAFAERRETLTGRASPASWAAAIDDALGVFGWPGERTLDSAEFQLVNRWRELLNEFVRLELVSPGLTIAEALGRLGGMAAETVFQPEAESALIQLMGPLEAAGMQFDRVWISGLGSAEWPPPGRPLPLLSSDLQKRLGMPDAEPADTLEFATAVLEGLLSSAPECRCSYSRTFSDCEQTATGLLAGRAVATTPAPDDPGWHAATLVATGDTVEVGEDAVPAMEPDEQLAGGAAVLQRQLDEPFAAFVLGRLGVEPLQPITIGLGPAIRGSLIHRALQQLYRDLPTQAELRRWSDADLERRVDDATDNAFRATYRNADAVLRALLRLEGGRTSDLLRAVVALDGTREPFAVAAVEKPLAVTIAGVALSLRADRIDLLDAGGHAILDYKTGAARRFLGSNKEPNDIQLVVYAYALGDDVSDLALFNVDSRAVGIDGAGRTFTPGVDWPAVLAVWLENAERAARELQQGDVRLFNLHSLQSARPLSLLSRIAELRRDA